MRSDVVVDDDDDDDDFLRLVVSFLSL